MNKINPYQPPADEVPENAESQLHADERQAQLRQTRDVPGFDFWLVSGIGTLLLLLASAIPNSPVSVLTLAWLSGSLRVILVVAVRAKAGLPPLNAIELLLTSTAICLILQVLAAGIVSGVLGGAWLLFHFRPSWRILLPVAFLLLVLVYTILFMWSIPWAKQT